MRPNKTREMLEQNLIEPTLTVKRSRVKVKHIKEQLFSNHGILEGNIQMLVVDPEKELPKVRWEILYLFAEQIHLKEYDYDINPKDYFTEHETKLAKQYRGNIIEAGDINLPLTLNNFIDINFNEYIGKINAETLAKISGSLLNYNFDIQRDPMKIKKSDGTVEEAPRTYAKNIEEMKNNLLDNSQKTTTIVIHASLGTADFGDDLSYNPENLQLTVNKGVILNILDGYHVRP